jgi:RIO-like serine/threonine protein kinase
MRALGRRDLPDALSIQGRIYRRAKTVKHDFWAATGFYDDDHGDRVVLKIGRVIDYCGIPLLWVGKWLCRREKRFYQALSDLPNVPEVLGQVGPTGFVHRYVPGQPLGNGRPVPDGFFDELMELLVELHRRQIAYVDTNKPQNILQGEDGRPHLIDFQISYDLHDFGDNWLNRQVLRRFQEEDFYHVLKHKRRLRPDEMTEAERIRSKKVSWAIQLHRFVSKPYFKFRRRTFRRLRETGQLLPEGSK